LADNSFTHLVVVGSSAGGIGALSGLVSSLPDDFDAPIVVAQHLDPNRESHLQEILARKSPLPVKTVTEHEPLQGGVVFVVPSNRHVNITDSEIELSSEPSSGKPMPSINLLMETAAGVFGENLIAIVLSGTGTDGTEGARTVSQAGGTVIIQDPETAEFGEMPRSLAPSTVDIVSSLKEIGPVLKNLISGMPVSEVSSEDKGRALEHFLEELHRNRGVDFRSYKRPTILRRLGRRMAVLDCESIDEYSRYLEEHPEEYRQLIGAFLIKVTEFFRDPELFDYLKEEVLPGLIEEAREEENQLRIWSAGCATGEEAYSLAILVSEVLGREAGLFNVRIFATDIDEDAVRFARRGVYPPSALEGLSEEQIGRYFVEEDGSYQVKKQIRGMIVFGEHDLAQRSPFPQVDLVVSRNVLIYFSGELQRRALQLFAYSLRDGGYLVMGKAESPSLLVDLFAPVDRQNKVYRRQGQRFPLPPTLPKGPAPRVRLERSFGDRGVNQGRAETQQQLSAASRTAGEELLNRLPVGIVGGPRLRHRGDQRRRPADALHPRRGRGAGLPARDARGALRRGPQYHRRSLQGRKDHTDRGVRRRGGHPRRAQLSAAHLLPRRVEVQGEQRVESVLVVVEDATAAVRMRRLSEKNLRLEEANRELSELNEELQAAHQESLVNTEEAQASAEEVETLNEELQATNEELETLNEELQATVEELNTTNDDLQSRATELQELAQSREEERQLTEAGRRRAEGLVEQLQSERSQLEAILVNMSDAVLAVDAEGKALFSNQVFQETFGVHTGVERNLLGSTEVLDEEGEKLASEATPTSRAVGGESFATRFAVAGKDGALRSFGANIRAIEGDGIAGCVLIIREVTDG
jgi:two-component system, chemotaxis family, CheB/CheR fusion protein